MFQNYNINYPRGAKKRSKKLRPSPRKRWKGNWNEFADIVKADIEKCVVGAAVAVHSPEWRFITVEKIAERLWYKEGNVEKAFMILNQRGLLSQRKLPFWVNRVDGWRRNTYDLTEKFIKEIKNGPLAHAG